MRWLRNLPVKRKLTLVILLTCSVVLLLACCVLSAYELLDFRRTMARDMVVLADVLAKNTRAALAFQDETAAQETLQALQSEPYVEAACLYNAKGNKFAEYARAKSLGNFPSQPGDDGYRFEAGHLVLYRPVVLNEKRIGTMYLRADLQGVYDRLQVFGSIAGVVLLGSILVAFALSSWLQRPISQPILDLAETARAIAVRKDFSVRAAHQEGHEIGLLTDALNQMLAGIEERAAALRAANDSLQAEINERKQAEGKVQAQLARLELLNQITRATGERQDLQSIFQVVIRSLEDHLPVDFCCVCLYDATAQTITVTRVGTQSAELAMALAMTEHARIAIDTNGLSRCVNGQLVYEPDISQVQFPFPQRLAKGGLRSLVAAPLLVESKVFGMIISARRLPDSFSSGECEFLRQLSEHVALAAHQAQLYDALQQAYDDLRQTQQSVLQQERLRALGQMASGIAHDINNAISPVALYTESLLENEPNLSTRARDYLETIQRAIGDVATTVTRMREFYRQREPQLTLAPVRLGPLVQQAVDFTKVRWNDMPQQRGTMVHMVVDLDPDLPVIMGVESELREALTNLIFNAVDAMPDGGTLTVRTRVVAGSSTVHGMAETKRVALEVADTGIGMDEGTRRRCLEPFYTTKGERGTGLGLAMVYGIVQRHGAEIEIESEVGKGTLMRLSFAAVASAAAVSTSPTPYAVPSRQRILIVDDDPLLIKSLSDTLSTEGHVVVAANGGQVGIEAFKTALAQNEPFAVVITDLGMPYVDGRKVASAIKAASPTTPVIMLTGWGQRLLAEGDIPHNVDRVLSKPPKLRDLREALAHCCPPNRL